LEAMGFNESKDTPSFSGKILNRDMDGPDLDTTWVYRSILGQIIYLKKLT